MSDTEFPKEHSNQEGTTHGYTVEARNGGGPVTVGDQIFDGEWRRVGFTKSAGGIPDDPMLSQYRLHSYTAAEALRWWFLAVCHRDFRICMETRLVTHQVKYKWTVTAIEAGHESEEWFRR